MARKKPERRVEQYGALTFYESTSRTCRWPDHEKRGPYVGRWRASIAAYPLVDDRGDEIYLCNRCKAEILSMWQDALEDLEEKAA